MKRLLCAVLSLCLICNFCYITTAGDITVSDSKLTEFTNQVTDMINGYSNNSHINTFSLRIRENDSSTNNNDDSINSNNCTNRLIIKSDDEIDKLNSIAYVSGYNDLHILQFANNEDFLQAYNYYLTLDTVEYIQEDMYVKENEVEISDKTQTQPAKIQSDIFGFTALKSFLSVNNIVYNDSITIAVVDTGIAYDHEFLKGRVIPTGFDSVNNESCYDDRGHGTHIAGIIAANTLNNVIIKPYKVLDNYGQGSDLQVYLGIQAAIEDGADIINLSLTRRGESEILHEAVKNAYNKGVVVVSAAGNKGVDIYNNYYSPACFDEVITVGSCSDDFYPSSFSNYGVLCEIFAPGENIYSTYLNNTYKIMSGTSMATPFICAAVSYILLSEPEISRENMGNTLRCNTKVCNGRKSALYLNAEYLTRPKTVTPYPIFSYTKSTFSDPFELKLSCANDSAVIYYNTSLMPSGQYDVYTEPISINHDMKVSAFSIVDGSVQSSVYNYSYTRLPGSDSLFSVDANGVLTGYNGDDIDIVIPLKVGSVTVKAIGSDTFKNNKNLRSIMIQGNNVTEISDEAFVGCTNLEYIRAKGVKSIGNNAFFGCSELLNFTGSKVLNVGDYAFYGCNALVGFDFTTVQTVGISAFESIPGINLTSNSFNKVSDRAFYNSGITGAALPVVNSIGDLAFAYCKDVEFLDCPRATVLGEKAFIGCTKLCEVSADSLTSLSNSVFEGCENIVGFSFNSLETLADQSGGYCTFNQYPLLEHFSAKSLLSVPENCFRDLYELTEVEMDSLETIESYAFYNCPKLKAFKSSATKIIKSYGLYGCSSLEEFNFKYLTDLYAYALGKTSIKTADFWCLKNVMKDAFNECDVQRVYLCVPELIEDLPDNGIVAISSTLQRTITAPTDTNAVIYAHTGSYALDYAESNGLEYVNMDEQSVFVSDITLIYSDINEKISVDAIGFKRQYTWYGTAFLDGSYSKELFSSYDSNEFDPYLYTLYPYYYCTVSSTDNGAVTTTNSGFCQNRLFHIFSLNNNVTLDFANTDSTSTSFGAGLIYLNGTPFDDINDVVGFPDDVVWDVVPSYDYKGTIIYGTDTKVSVTYDMVTYTYYLVVDGDVNGDGYMDVLDVSLVEKAVNNQTSLTNGAYNAANLTVSSSDDSISLTDYQLFVNKVLAN